MLRVAVMVSGGGTNLQAIIDGVKNGTITNTEIVAVISNNAGAYALTRAKDNGIAAYCVSPKDYVTRDEFNKALLDKVNSLNVDLVVLAGFLVKIPEEMVHQYSHRIINIHPSLILLSAELASMDFMSMRRSGKGCKGDRRNCPLCG